MVKAFTEIQVLLIKNGGQQTLLNQQLLPELKLPQELLQWKPKMFRFGLDQKRQIQTDHTCGTSAIIFPKEPRRTQPIVLRAKVNICLERLLQVSNFLLVTLVEHCLSLRFKLLLKMTARKIWKENHTDARPVKQSLL